MNLARTFFAGLVMALPGALLALGARRWCRNKPNGQAALAAFFWWAVSAAWFCAAGGFVLLWFLASAFGNTGHDGVLGTALKIGALGGGLCGLLMGGSVGLVRMLLLAHRQPNS